MDTVHAREQRRQFNVPGQHTARLQSPLISGGSHPRALRCSPPFFLSLIASVHVCCCSFARWMLLAASTWGAAQRARGQQTERRPLFPRCVTARHCCCGSTIASHLQAIVAFLPPLLSVHVCPRGRCSPDRAADRQNKQTGDGRTAGRADPTHATPTPTDADGNTSTATKAKGRKREKRRRRRRDRRTR